MVKLLPRALPRNLHKYVFGLTFIDQKGPSVVSMRSVMCLLKFLPFSLHGAVWLLAVAQRFCSAKGFFFLTIARRVGEGGTAPGEARLPGDAEYLLTPHLSRRRGLRERMA